MQLDLKIQSHINNKVVNIQAEFLVNSAQSFQHDWSSDDVSVCRCGQGRIFDGY